MTATLVACFEDPVGDESAETGGQCEAGQVDCECLPNQTCFGTFECVQGLCLEPTATGDGDGDPTTGDGDGDGDPTTGDGDGDPTTGDGDGDPSTGDGDGDGDGDPMAECGDGNVDPGEACDGGPLNGVELGNCNPECSGLVTEKRIIVTAAMFNGNLGGVAGADAKCPNGYLAMISDGIDRVATVSPNAGDGQVDWVLEPYTHYTNASDKLVFVTDGVALLSVQGGQLLPLMNSIAETDDGSGVWTGMLQDWTADIDCDNWTVGTMASTGRNADSSVVTNYISNGGTSQCQFARKLYCVEQ